MTFGEAYKIVCPDCRPVVPGSQDMKDIVELMRQSGHLHYTDRLVHEAVPVVPKRIDQVRRFTERPVISPETTRVSKKQWLSVAANREAFNSHITNNLQAVQVSVPADSNLKYKECCVDRPSKKQWMSVAANQEVFNNHINKK